MKKVRIIAIAAIWLIALAQSTTACAQQSDRQGYRDERYDGRMHQLRRSGHYLSDEEFNFLYNKVKKASFDNDKYSLIEVANLGCLYSCKQTASLMKIFTFDDDKIKVLKMMAPNIVDLHNAIHIYKIFTFSDDKDKAADIIQKSIR